MLYLKEIYYRTFYTGITFIFTFFICYNYAIELINIFLTFFIKQKIITYFILVNFTEIISINIKISLFFTLLIIYPYILSQIYLYIIPSTFLFEKIKITKIYFFIFFYIIIFTFIYYKFYYPLIWIFLTTTLNTTNISFNIFLENKLSDFINFFFIGYFYNFILFLFLIFFILKKKYLNLRKLQFIFVILLLNIYPSFLNLILSLIYLVIYENFIFFKLFNKIIKEQKLIKKPS